jgi:hypothetical protein
MRTRICVIGGALGAFHLGLDGFRSDSRGRPLEWPPSWCAPRSARAHHDVFRARGWLEPLPTAHGLVAHPLVILRQLSTDVEQLKHQRDNITSHERLELAIEHLLRMKMISLPQLHAITGPGSRPIRHIMNLRGTEPPTESYAETRAVQLCRRLGYSTVRQLVVQVDNRDDYRIDLEIPFQKFLKRPHLFLNGFGLGIEVDSAEFHQHQFERDHQRQSDYNALKLDWISLTPRQIEHQQGLVRGSIEGGIVRAGRSLVTAQRVVPMSPKRQRLVTKSA